MGYLLCSSEELKQSSCRRDRKDQSIRIMTGTQEISGYVGEPRLEGGGCQPTSNVQKHDQRQGPVLRNLNNLSLRAGNASWSPSTLTHLSQGVRGEKEPHQWYPASITPRPRVNQEMYITLTCHFSGLPPASSATSEVRGKCKPFISK